MKSKNKYLTLIISVCFFLSAVPSSGGKIAGEVTISDNNGDLRVELNMSGQKGDAGRGFLRYIGGGARTNINISYLKINNKYGWFAGECVESGDNKVGRWFFGAVYDGGEPGRLVDLIWWEWVPQSENAKDIARNKVKNMEVPSGRKKIQSGNISISN